MTGNKLIRSQRPLLELTATEIPYRDPLRLPDNLPRISREQSRLISSRSIPAEVRRRNAARRNRLSLGKQIARSVSHFLDEFGIVLIGFILGLSLIFFAAAISIYVPSVLPLTMLAVAISFGGWISERFLQVWAWSATVAVLTLVAFGLEGPLQFLSSLSDLLTSWMTYRIIAGLALLCLLLVFLGRCGVLDMLLKEAATAPAPDPRGYGRYAIDDFVEKNTYGDADLAQKGDLHLALSRKGNENLRFTPKFLE